MEASWPQPAESLEKLNKQRCGIILGSGMGGMGVFVDGVQALAQKGIRQVTPFFVPISSRTWAEPFWRWILGSWDPTIRSPQHAPQQTIRSLQLRHTCATEMTDVMICGGSEAAIIQMGMAGFCACKALSQRNDAPEKASRPWDRGRDGFVMGEGAGVLVLETLEHAQARGATILAEYLGGGLSCDAYHMTEPRGDGEGVALCVETALADAGVSADKVDYINAHATSTPLGDMAEINALKKVFSHRERIIINSTKSMIGHALGLLVVSRPLLRSRH